MSTYAAITRITPAMLPRAVTTSRGDRNAVFRGIGERVMGETTTYYKLRAPAPTTTGYHEWYNTTGDDTGKPPSPATTGPTVIVERFQVRAYAAPPAIVSASGTTYAGGTVVVTGQEFREGMRILSDTVLLGTATVTSKTTATVVVPYGARAGVHTLVAVHVGGNSGLSGVNKLVVDAINPATLPLSLWLTAEDFVDAAHPAQPTWVSRASAGTSGGRRLYRKSARTINPTKITEDGLPAVFFDGTGGNPSAEYNTNAHSNIAAPAGPLDPLLLTDFATVAGGFSFLLAVSHPPGVNTGLTSAQANFINPAIFGGEYNQPNSSAGYSPYLIATTNGYQLVYTTDDPTDYYQGTRPETPVPANTFTILAGYLKVAPDNRSAFAALRSNRGVWTTKTFTNLGTQAVITPANFHIAGFFYAGNYGKVATPKIREIITAPTQFTLPTFEFLTDRLAYRWNIPL